MPPGHQKLETEFTGKRFRRLCAGTDRRIGEASTAAQKWQGGAGQLSPPLVFKASTGMTGVGD